jgi:hypothetical protein
LNSGVAAAAEVLAGAAVAHAGVGQMLALFVALVLSAGGVALSAHPSASGVTSARWGAAAYLAAFALALGVVSPGTTASWTLLGYVAAVCVLLPRPLGWLALLAVVGLHVLLTWISRVKAGLTGLPVTVLDIQIALANPSGLWDALGLPQWTRYPTTVVLALGVLSMPVAVLQAGRRLALRGARIRPGDGL